MKRNLNLAAGILAGIAVATSAALIAGPVTLPNTFASGTPARAADVNANFNAVRTAVNDNDSRITADAARITTAEGRLTVIESRVTPAGNLVLPAASSATSGTVLKGVDRFIHTFGTDNTFVGINAGNFTMSGIGNTVIGDSALSYVTSGSFNIALGLNAMGANETGSNNVAVGKNALMGNLSGRDNVAVGTEALTVNNVGISNTALGHRALAHNSSGNDNTAVGRSALTENRTGEFNTAVGVNALLQNVAGNSNTAVGYEALATNNGEGNTATGGGVLRQNSTGSRNTGMGAGVMYANTTGADNTAIGTNALAYNKSGNTNTAIGAGALEFLEVNGAGHVNNIALGYRAGRSVQTGSNNILIGHEGFNGDNSLIRLGSVQSRTLIAGIRGVTTGVANAVPVVIDSNGQLGTLSSSRSVKDDIEDMNAASDVLRKLRPVTFHYKSDRNASGRMLQYGLVAEEVEQVAPQLVAHSADGKIETVYYQFLAPMLLNEVQKLQRIIETQAKEIEQLKLLVRRIDAMERRLGQDALLSERGVR